MKKIFAITICSTLACNVLQGQAEFSKWYFGATAGLDFSTNPPTVLTDNVMTTSEGVAAISDNTGNLLFYTDGQAIANKNHVAMDNGIGLLGDQSSTQAAMIVKQPGNSNLYYVFTEGGNLCYSVVDMNLAAGMGSVTAKNVTLCTATCEKQVAVRHCNGKDVWILTHEFNTNIFRSFLLTSVGINTNGISSAIGDVPNTYSTTPGHLKVSPDGKKIAMSTYSSSVPSSIGSGGLVLFSFDNATGIISNSLNLLSANYAYGVEFSPDGSKLYCLRSVSLVTGGSSILHQWDVCQSTTASIAASQYTTTYPYLGGALQWAINNKIYVVGTNASKISVIHSPNSSGAAMNFAIDDINIHPKITGIGLPNYINPYQKPHFTGFTSSVSCQQISVTAPAVPAFTSGCGGPSFQPAGYLWDFNDPSSGAENTSSLSTVKHTFSALGTYTVKLIMYSSCTNDTLTKVVTISTPGPSVNLSGNFSVCKGDRYTYSVSGSGSYSWSANATSPTVALSPTATTAYTVSGTTNGCTLSKVFTVNVTVCTDVEKWEETVALKIFPNPFTGNLKILSPGDAIVTISDLSGKTILSANINAGENNLTTDSLPAGIYILHSTGKNGVWHTRIIKTR